MQRVEGERTPLISGDIQQAAADAITVTIDDVVTGSDEPQSEGLAPEYHRIQRLLLTAYMVMMGAALVSLSKSELNEIDSYPKINTPWDMVVDAMFVRFGTEFLSELRTLVSAEKPIADWLAYYRKAGNGHFFPGVLKQGAKFAASFAPAMIGMGMSYAYFTDFLTVKYEEALENLDETSPYLYLAVLFGSPAIALFLIGVVSRILESLINLAVEYKFPSPNKNIVPETNTSWLQDVFKEVVNFADAFLFKEWLRRLMPNEATHDRYFPVLVVGMAKVLATWRYLALTHKPIDKLMTPALATQSEEERPVSYCDKTETLSAEVGGYEMGAGVGLAVATLANQGMIDLVAAMGDEQTLPLQTKLGYAGALYGIGTTVDWLVRSTGKIYTKASQCWSGFWHKNDSQEAVVDEKPRKRCGW